MIDVDELARIAAKFAGLQPLQVAGIARLFSLVRQDGYEAGVKHRRSGFGIKTRELRQSAPAVDPVGELAERNPSTRE